MSKKGIKKSPILKIIGVIMPIIVIVLIFIGIRSTFAGNDNMLILIVIGITLMFPSIGITIYAFKDNFIEQEKNDIIQYGVPMLKEIEQELHQDKSDIICPNCKSLNGSGNKFCKDCGFPLTTTCPHCNSEINIDSKFCIKCGKKIK